MIRLKMFALKQFQAFSNQSLFACITLLGFSAPAYSQNFQIADLTVGGKGCPQTSEVKAESTDQGIRLTLPKIELEGQTRSLKRAQCQAIVRLKHPGWRYRIKSLNVEVQGHRLDPRDTLSATLHFQGAAETQRAKHQMNSAGAVELALNGGWSPCTETSTFVIGMGLRSKRRQDLPSMSEIRHVNLDWERCNASP